MPSEPPKEPATISSIQRYGGKDAARVVVLVSRPTLFEVGEVAADSRHGSRFFVDIKDSRFRGKREIAGDGMLERIRIGEKGAATRVVLDLSAAASHRVFYSPRAVPTGHRRLYTSGRARSRRNMVRVTYDAPCSIRGHGGYDPGATGPGGLREKDVVLDIAHRAAPLIAREHGISTLLTRDSDVFVPLDERAAHANAFSFWICSSPSTATRASRQ